jgi:hypothetical protein
VASIYLAVEQPWMFFAQRSLQARQTMVSEGVDCESGAPRTGDNKCTRGAPRLQARSDPYRLGLDLHFCYPLGANESIAAILCAGSAVGLTLGSSKGMHGPQCANEQPTARPLSHDAEPMRRDVDAGITWLLAEATAERSRQCTLHQGSYVPSGCSSCYLVGCLELVNPASVFIGQVEHAGYPPPKSPPSTISVLRV